MRFLRGILTRLYRIRPRRRVMRTYTGSFGVELYHDKTPIRGRVDVTLTEINPKDDE